MKPSKTITAYKFHNQLTDEIKSEIIQKVIEYIYEGTIDKAICENLNIDSLCLDSIKFNYINAEFRHRGPENNKRIIDKIYSDDQQKQLAEQVVHFMIKNSHTKTETMKKFNLSESVYLSLCARFNIYRSEEDIHKETTRRLQEKYGVRTTLQLPGMKEHIEKLCIERYGVNHFSKVPEVIEKISISNKHKAAQNMNKRSKTMIEKYGVDHPSKLPDIKERTEKTMLSRYGVKHSSMLKENRQKAAETCLKNNGVDCIFKDRERMVNSYRKLYGVDNPAKNDKIKNKIAKSLSDEYGRVGHQQQWSLETFNTLSNETNLKHFILSFKTEDRHCYWLAKQLNISESCLMTYVNKYNLRNCLSTTKSSLETEIREWIQSLGVDCSTSRSIIPPKELDIYIKDHKFAIEVNGSYWHCDECVSKNYHKQKSEECKHNGVVLYHIWEYEWHDKIKQPIIKSQIMHKLKLCNNTIYARECDIRLVSVEDAREFLNHNHLQGYRNCSIRIGLYHKDTLVSIATFGIPYIDKSRQKQSTIELYRYATALNTNVTGGFSKLMSHINEYTNANEIITYCDFSKSYGEGYLHNGFEYINNSVPNYIWINTSTNDVKTRYQTQMKNENMIMRNNGYLKLYDCGNIKLRKDLNKKRR